ncbi:MAG: hypothetical protein IKQ51_04340 [Bacteroidaceae bacterium]|nr:hypothetical protein [Bacteroidaceae bacterium]
MMRIVLKVVGSCLSVVVVLMLAAMLLLSTDGVQNRLIQYAVGILKKQLETELSIGHVSISPIKGGVTLCDVEIEDRQGRKMFQMGKLTLGLDLGELWQKNIVIRKANVSGLKAFLCKPASASDSSANYMFLKDAFKVNRAHTEKKPITFRMEKATVNVDSFCYQTDNGKPRKNVGRPHRGAFDAGHLDVHAAMNVMLCQSADDKSMHVAISDFHATDRGSGLLVDSLVLLADVNKDSICINEVRVRLPNSIITLSKGRFWLGDSLHYTIPDINLATQLKDIAQPFGPRLNHFTTLLMAQCSMSGDKEGLRFDNVHVSTANKKLRIEARGRITNLKDKHKTRVHFDMKRMVAQNKTVQRIVNHFATKKHMMKQLGALGQVTFKGCFDVLFKKEVFVGKLGTEVGDIDLNFTVDGLNKYLYGNVETSTFQLGRVMDMTQVGEIGCSANFRFDISKQRTAQMRRQKGGKLPIGRVDAEVQKVSCVLGTLHNISATIVSDGSEAVGQVVEKRKHMNMGCDFSFTDTDQMHKLKVKPRLKKERKAPL